MPIYEKPTDDTKGQLTDTTLEKVLNVYGFDKSWSILPIVPMNGTLVVLNSKAETTKKAVIKYKGQVFLLKQVPWYCSTKDFVDFMLSFNQLLHSQGFPVPQLIRSNEEELFVEIDGELYYLQEFITGTVYSNNIIQVFEAGYNLGNLHLFSVNLSETSINMQKLKFRENSFQLANKMLQVLECNVIINENFIKKQKLNLLLNYCEKAKQFLTKLESKINKNYYEKYIQIHGDYNPFNLLYEENGKVIATLDWENTVLDHPIHDVAEGLLGFCFK